MTLIQIHQRIVKLNGEILELINATETSLPRLRGSFHLRLRSTVEAMRRAHYHVQNTAMPAAAAAAGDQGKPLPDRPPQTAAQLQTQLGMLMRDMLDLTNELDISAGSAEHATRFHDCIRTTANLTYQAALVLTSQAMPMIAEACKAPRPNWNNPTNRRP
jgi:hypothetical protein